MHAEPFRYSFNGFFQAIKYFTLLYFTLLPSSNNFQLWYLFFIFFSCRSAWTSSRLIHLSTYLTLFLSHFYYSLLSYFTLSLYITSTPSTIIIIPYSNTNSNLSASYYIYILNYYRFVCQIVLHFYYYSLDARVQKHLAAKRVFFSARPVRLYTSSQTI